MDACCLQTEARQSWAVPKRLREDRLAQDRPTRQAWAWAELELGFGCEPRQGLRCGEAQEVLAVQVGDGEALLPIGPFSLLCPGGSQKQG